MSQENDWDKLSTEQQKAVDAWRERVAVMIDKEREDFEAKHSELRLNWQFTADPLIRTDHPVIYEESPRDTLFAGYAKLLFDEYQSYCVYFAATHHHLSTDDYNKQCREGLQQMIAQRAYDFTAHIMRSQAQGIEILSRDDPEYIAERVSSIPDMRQWPKDG